MQENTIEKLYELDKELTCLQEEEKKLIEEEKELGEEEIIIE